MAEEALGRTYKAGRKIVIAVVGGTIILIGLGMIVLPGPAVVVIPVGLGVLGLEFAWARRFLRHIREATEATLNRLRGATQGEAESAQGLRNGDTATTPRTK